MGRRRKRRNSDVDDSIEAAYHSQNQSQRIAKDEQDDKSREVNKAEPTTATSTKNKDVEHDVAKIEQLRLKKQRRKDQKAAKAKQRQEGEANRKRHQEEEAEKIKSLKRQKKAEATSKASNAFTTIQKGVQYQDIVVGKGPLVRDRKKIRVSYTLRAKNRHGKILDTSDDFGFRLGRGEVVKGWDLGIQGMRQGGKRFLIVPPQAGYGSENIGAGSGATLFFEVTLLNC